MKKHSILRKIKYGVEHTLFLGLIGVILVIPLDVASNFFAKLLRSIAQYGRRQRRVLENLEKAFPDISGEEREKIALKMWENLGRTLVETIHLNRILNEPERFEVLNQDIIDKYKDDTNAQIYLSLHTGNWELGIAPVTWAGYHPAAVYRLIKNPHVDAFVRKARERLFPGGFFAKGDQGDPGLSGQRTVREIMQYIREGGRVCIMADLYDSKGLPVPFFGHPAKSTPYPAMLARQTGCRLWVGRCIRVNDQSRFQIEFTELEVHNTDDKAADVRKITADVQKQFENWIREYPEQWAWYHRKWS